MVPQQYIAVEAYKLHLANPHASAEENWLQAEKNLTLLSRLEAIDFGGVDPYAKLTTTQHFLLKKENRFISHYCREMVEKYIHELAFSNASLGYYDSQLEATAQRIRDLEIHHLKLTELSRIQICCVKRFFTNCDGEAPNRQFTDHDILWITFSDFWKADPCRISFFTHYLKYGNQGIDAWLNEYSNVRPSFEAFLSGRNRFVGQWYENQDDTHYGWQKLWVHKFKNKTRSEVEEVLIP